MQKITSTQLARKLREVLDAVERGNKEFVITRNQQTIAYLARGVPQMSVYDALGDLYRVIDDETAQSWVTDGRNPQTVAQNVRDPWDS